MGYMGDELQRERESRGLSLLQVEEITKIRVKYLEALENENFNVIPGKVYVKGFVKNYAAFLGLNVEPFLEYLNDTTFSQTEVEEEKEFVVTNTQSTSPFGLKYVFAALVVIAIGYVFITNSSSDGNLSSTQKENTISAQPEAQENKGAATAENSQTPTSGTENTAAVTPQTGAVTNKSVTKESVTTNPTPVENPNVTKPETTTNAQSSVVLASNPNAKVNVVLRAARQNSWALVKVDGKVKFQGLINLNQQLAFNGQQAIYVKLGNAGAIDVYHNGKLLGALGPTGQISKQTFN